MSNSSTTISATVCTKKTCGCVIWGMAYGTMASLPPICGLYTSLFGPLTYFFFGSSRHVSMGTIVVVSLMVAAVLDTRLAVDDVMSPAILNMTLNATFTDLEIDHERAIFARKIQIATALSFVSGIAMMLLGKLGVGFVTSYMSEYLVKGFTTGIAIHAVSSQMKNILGLKVKRFNGAFKVIKAYAACRAKIAWKRVRHGCVTQAAYAYTDRLIVVSAHGVWLPEIIGVTGETHQL